MDATLVMKVLAYAVANAGPAIKTFGELKNLVVDGFNDLSGTYAADTPLEELRSGVLADMDEIKQNSAEIQQID